MDLTSHIGRCHVHERMRSRKPHLKDNLPNQLCVLCNRPFCVDHKGKEEGVCEINHETYYRNHPEAQGYLYRTYEDLKKDQEELLAYENSGDEGVVPVGGEKK